MSAERQLNNVLQHYQQVQDAAKTEQIIGSTTYLLTELSNPRNIEVLTSQLLTAAALWNRHSELRTSLRIISIYNTAATHIRNHAQEPPKLDTTRQGQRLSPETWARSVVKGADGRSKRWQHLLVLTGILMGFEGNDRSTLSTSTRNVLGEAVVTAANLAFKTTREDGVLACSSIVMALNFAFPLLSPSHQANVDCDALLPLSIHAMTGEEGYGEGRFLRAISQDTTTASSGALEWSPNSPSFQHTLEMGKHPVLGNMGPLSKLVAFAVHNAKDPGVVLQSQDALLVFTRHVAEIWASMPFSDIDPSAESQRLSLEMLTSTWRPLWDLLQRLFFAVIVVVQATVSRSLVDARLLPESTAPGMAAKTLHILSNLFFIGHRDGNDAFQIYNFAYLTSIDIISRSPQASENFLRSLQPFDAEPNHIPYSSRIRHLFYLNLAEHLPLTLSTAACDSLIVKPATLFLTHQGPLTSSMVELFESAHSAVLAVLSCPQHSLLTTRVAPFYIITLLDSFPDAISSRQFRIAFKTVMQIVSPPFPIAASDPHLSETLLEMLRSQIAVASTDPLPAGLVTASPGDVQHEEPLTKQSALVLTLIDAIPFLPLDLLEDWLTITAQSLNEITNQRMREPVRRRLWDMLVGGEMDVERAAIGVAWWGSHGGRELISASASGPAMMSGAIVSVDPSSKI